MQKATDIGSLVKDKLRLQNQLDKQAHASAHKLSSQRLRLVEAQIAKLDQAFIQGGRKPLHNALYMPALVATRFNPNLKAQYNSMKAASGCHHCHHAQTPDLRK